jgi:hypothetical protein
MRTHNWKRWVFVAVSLVGLLTAPGQSAQAGLPAVAVGSNKDAALLPAGSVLREIDDPCTGDRWLLARDPTHPDGPGRLVLDASSAEGAGHSASGNARGLTHPPLRFMIHAGDTLVIEEHSAVVDARLEATALGPAFLGAEFRARLKVGGKVVRVVALGPGQAAFVRERTARQ